ncbi:MAG: hypothetical protein J1E59_03735 [Treponema sp.]|nr:hypothetical protein [Treponema sp.]
MKVNKRVLASASLCFAAALVYFFLNYIPLKKELQLTPEWTADISEPTQADDGERLPFRLGRNFGYFSPSGKISLLKKIPYKATVSKNFFALYERDAQGIKVFDSAGSPKFDIKGAGFPFIQDDRIFLMLPGGNSFAFVESESGAITSVYESSAPITSFHSSKGGVAVGYADGEFLVFSSDGSLKFPLSPGASEFPVILGGAISDSGKMFACVSGQDPQRIVLYKDEENYQKIIFHQNLNKSLARQTFVHFSENEEFVYFDTAESLVIVDTKRFEAKSVLLSGSVLDIQESEVANSVFVLSRNGKVYTVTILENFDEEAGEFSFEAENAFILVEGNSLYVGRDEKISRLAISKE